MKLRHLLIVLAVLVLLWSLLALIFPQPIFPNPWKVGILLWQEIQAGELFLHLGVSLLRILVAVLVAMVLGIPLGMGAALSPGLGRVLSPLLYLGYPVPKIAFLPILMVLFGLGDAPKILLITGILFFPVAVNVRDSVRSLPREYAHLRQIFRLNRLQYFQEILLPGILPQLLSTLRISIGISLSVLFFAENFGTTWGMGHYIMNSWIMADYPLLYVGILVLSLSGVALYLLLDTLEKLLVPWKNTDKTE